MRLEPISGPVEALILGMDQRMKQFQHQSIVMSNQIQELEKSIIHEFMLSWTGSKDEYDT